VCGLTVIFMLTVFMHSPLIYDEAPYLKPVALIHQHGLSLEFLRNYPEPAGLLHNVLHWALEPITGLRPPLVRMVNPTLLLLVIILTALTLREAGSTQALASSLTFLGIPFTWVVAGMALTEMPSIALTSLSTYLLVVASKSQAERVSFSLSAALCGGIALGMAFLSRAMVLVVLGALPCLLIVDWRRSSWIVAAFTLGAILVAGPIVALWGGLVPPHSVVPVSAASFSAHHLILSVAYAATVMLILAPGWFALDRRLGLGIFGVVFAPIALSGWAEISVARAVFAQLPSSISSVVPRLAGSLMVALAVLFVICSAKNLYARRFDPKWTFFCVSMLLLIVSSGKIVHQYSSRYTAMASGMMILACDPFTMSNKWRVLRIAFGMVVGLASLLSYYDIPG
jgi:4-amino-4-deoxy-L-arabinose transferase-like glycosyltransferase